jgi:hypothetical protein
VLPRLKTRLFDCAFSVSRFIPFPTLYKLLFSRTEGAHGGLCMVGRCKVHRNHIDRKGTIKLQINCSRMDLTKLAILCNCSGPDVAGWGMWPAEAEQDGQQQEEHEAEPVEAHEIDIVDVPAPQIPQQKQEPQAQICLTFSDGPSVSSDSEEMHIHA